LSYEELKNKTRKNYMYKLVIYKLFLIYEEGFFFLKLANKFVQLYLNEKFFVWMVFDPYFRKNLIIKEILQK